MFVLVVPNSMRTSLNSTKCTYVCDVWCHDYLWECVQSHSRVTFNPKSYYSTVDVNEIASACDVIVIANEMCGNPPNHFLLFGNWCGWRESEPSLTFKPKNFEWKHARREVERTSKNSYCVYTIRCHDDAWTIESSSESSSSSSSSSEETRRHHRKGTVAKEAVGPRIDGAHEVKEVKESGKTGCP
jgi:hypothetical protein